MNRTSSSCSAQRPGLRQPCCRFPEAALLPSNYENQSSRTRRQQGWLPKAAAGLPQSGFVLLLLASTASAGPRSSANYTVATDTADAGGKRTTSASYTNDASAGGVAGTSTVAAPAETAKHGYIGQLTEITALQLAAAPATVDETATRQLSAAELLDDLTTSDLPANAIAWSVLSGPLTGISQGGLATAATVYQNTIATAQGIHAGHTATFDLTVVNILPDNFGAYAGDGLTDDWQVQYFGLNNPLAAPLLDPDSDGDTNLFEYHARLIPTDPASFLSITLIPGPNASMGIAAGQAKLLLSPGKPGTTYTIEHNGSLLPADWATLTTIPGAEGTLSRTDTAAGTRKFYRVTPARTP